MRGWVPAWPSEESGQWQELVVAGWAGAGARAQGTAVWGTEQGLPACPRLLTGRPCLPELPASLRPVASSFVEPGTLS